MAVKKQSRLKKIIGVFNPTTRKGGMALFVLVFVVVGGGYMAYRSFAHTLNGTYVLGPGSPGIMHKVGNKRFAYYDIYPKGTSGWIRYLGGPNEPFMWYGPNHAVTLGGGVQACWTYASVNKSGVDNTAYIDVVATNSSGARITFFSTFLILETDPYIKYQYEMPGNPGKTHVYCTPMLYAKGIYTDLVIRMKAHDIPNTLVGNKEYIDLLRTKYQTYIQ